MSTILTSLLESRERNCEDFMAVAVVSVSIPKGHWRIDSLTICLLESCFVLGFLRLLEYLLEFTSRRTVR